MPGSINIAEGRSYSALLNPKKVLIGVKNFIFYTKNKVKKSHQIDQKKIFEKFFFPLLPRHVTDFCRIFFVIVVDLGEA